MRQTHSETRKLNAQFARGTILDFLDAEGARRTGRVERAEAGKLVVRSPVPPSRKRHGLTPAEWEAASSLYRVAVDAQLERLGVGGRAG